MNHRVVGRLRTAHAARGALSGVLLLLGLWVTALGAVPRAQTDGCQLEGELVRLKDLPEASGLAASRSVQGRLWAHNDSGPTLFALDSGGSVTGRVQLSGAPVEDWEAIAVGPCPAGSCVYVADIGDNDAKRKSITVYRFPEPSPADRTASVSEVFHAAYPDGSHDAETLLVTPDGGLFIVTKGDTGPVGVYRFPRELGAGPTVKLEAVGRLHQSGQAGRDERITDGSVSPDGETVVLRTGKFLEFHRAADLLAGTWREVRRVPLDAVREPQGEGVAFAGDNTLYVVGEGGGKSQPGTFARLTCAPRP